MHVFELTRALIDIDSVTPNEEEIGSYLFDYLRPLADRYGGSIEKQEVEPGRNNVWIHWGAPQVVFSTHMDTVPPFIPSREDDEFIWGRGACDTHGIAAAMIKAVEALLAEGVRGLGLLLVVGEEVNGLGARHANKTPPPGVRYLINGEPTENLLALGSKGVLGLKLRAARPRLPLGLPRTRRLGNRKAARQPQPPAFAGVAERRTAGRNHRSTSARSTPARQ